MGISWTYLSRFLDLHSIWILLVVNNSSVMRFDAIAVVTEDVDRFSPPVFFR